MRVHLFVGAGSPVCFCVFFYAVVNIQARVIGININKCTQARCGQLDILKWIHANDNKGVKLYWSLFVAAAAGGQLEVLKWIREQNVDACIQVERRPKHSFELVKWLEENDLYID